MLNLMKELGIPVGVSSHNIWIQSLCMLKSNEAKALFQDAVKRDKTVTYNHLEEGNLEEAKRFQIWCISCVKMTTLRLL